MPLGTYLPTFCPQTSSHALNATSTPPFLPPYNVLPLVSAIAKFLPLCSFIFIPIPFSAPKPSLPPRRYLQSTPFRVRLLKYPYQLANPKPPPPPPLPLRLHDSLPLPRSCSNLHLPPHSHQHNL